MKLEFVFYVELKGKGKNVNDAWRNAVESFSLDSGVPDDYEMILTISK